MALLISVLEQGMIYGIMALGVYITYKILDFPDLTVDGSFPMGVAVTAVLISKGVNPLLTLPVSLLAGALIIGDEAGRTAPRGCWSHNNSRSNSWRTGGHMADNIIA